MHVWRFPLDLPPQRLAILQRWLSPDEVARSERFHFQRDRDHFLAARGSLREILARYCKVEPGRLLYTYGPYGKPELFGEPCGSGVSFNLSHAHELGLLAVAGGPPVGVDIEYIRADLAGEEIARRFFSTREVESLFGLPEALRVEAFFTCWTRKEAFIKAIGEGLSLPLERFDVTLAPGEPAALLATRPDPQEAARWSLHHLEPGAGYVGALAVAGRIEWVRCWSWNGASGQP